MNKRKAEEIIRGLQAPQHKRLVMFTNNLSTDKDPGIFDDRMYDYILEVSESREWVEAQLNYLNSIGWNQSKYRFGEIKKQAERFTAKNHDFFGWNRNYKRAKERLIRESEQLNLRTLQYDGNDKIEEYLPREDTAAGWSYIDTGKKSKGQYREELHEQYKIEVMKAKIAGSFNKPILPGTRTQANNPYYEDGSHKNEYVDKSRLVSMVDIYQIMAEVVFAKRLQTRFSQIPWYAGGKNDQNIWFYMTEWKKKFKYWLSIDFSKFDQSISDWMIRDAFDVIRAAYKDDPNFDEDLFKIVREDFINKVIILGLTDDLIYESKKGVPSGSMFTQLVDSIVNRIMIETYLFSQGIETYVMMIMGDDNIIFTNVEIDTHKLASYLDHNFGIEMHPLKCKSGQCSDSDPEFLSRRWTFKGVWRTPEHLFAKLVFPERYRDYKNNPQLHPSMIVECYMESFPLGMTFITGAHRKRAIDWKSAVGDGRWLTGLMRYRLLYAS